jgi:hypothetical protein
VQEDSKGEGRALRLERENEVRFTPLKDLKGEGRALYAS